MHQTKKGKQWYFGMKHILGSLPSKTALRIKYQLGMVNSDYLRFGFWAALFTMT